MMNDDDDEYDFEYLDKLVEKHQALCGSEPANPQRCQQQQPQHAKPFAEDYGQQAPGAYGRPLQPLKHAPHLWPQPSVASVPPGNDLQRGTYQEHHFCHNGNSITGTFCRQPQYEKCRSGQQQEAQPTSHLQPWQQPQPPEQLCGKLQPNRPAHSAPYPSPQQQRSPTRKLQPPHGASVVAFPSEQHGPVPSTAQQWRIQQHQQHEDDRHLHQRPQQHLPRPQQQQHQQTQVLTLPPHETPLHRGQQLPTPGHLFQEQPARARLAPMQQPTYPQPVQHQQLPQPMVTLPAAQKQQQQLQNVQRQHPHHLQGPPMTAPLPQHAMQAPGGLSNPPEEQQQQPVSRRQVTFTASLALEDNKCFAVKVDYHDALKAVFGLITSASGYDHVVKGWTFPLAQYKHVMDALTDGRLRTRGLDVSLQPTLPEFVGRMLHSAATRPNDERLYDKLTRRAHESEQSLDERMMSFQRDGVRHGLRLGGRVLIGDEMGLGKTVQACCLLKCYSEDWPALVVVPKSLRETWADALHMWLKLTEPEVLVINSPADMEKLRGLPSAAQPRVMVLSYDTLTRAPEQLRELKLKMVVLDEAHYIKNGKAQRTQATLPLLQQARRVVLLTGTPALSKPAELVPLLQGLMPSAHIKALEFSERYSVRDKRYPSKFFGSRNESELNRLLLGTVMVRRLKRDVLKHLPAKRRQQVFIRLPDADMRNLDRMSRELEGIKTVADSMMSAGGGHALAGVNREQQQTIMRLWRDTAALKAAAVAEYCSDLLEADEAKFLLFAHHKVLLNAVEEKAKSCKARYIRIDGSTDSASRAEYVKRFQEDADIKVAILSIQAAGVGLTMTASSLVVFAELSWVPGDIQQAEDRCHRIGQHTSVNIHFLLVRGSVDEIMWDTLQNKLGNVGKVLDGNGAFIKVDATREVRGLGASVSAAQPRLDGTVAGASGGCNPSLHANGEMARLGRGQRSPGSSAGAIYKAPAVGGRGAVATRSGGSEGNCTAMTAVGGMKPTAAATRRISDFYTPVKNAKTAGAAGSKTGHGDAGAVAGQKRMRAASPGSTDLINDDDAHDFREPG